MAGLGAAAGAFEGDKAREEAAARRAQLAMQARQHDANLKQRQAELAESGRRFDAQLDYKKEQDAITKLRWDKQDERLDKQDERQARLDALQLERFNKQDERQNRLDMMAMERHNQAMQLGEMHMDESRMRLNKYIEAGKQEALEFEQMRKEQARQAALMTEGISGLMAAGMQNPISPGTVPSKALQLFNMQYGTDFDMGIFDMQSGRLVFTQPRKDEQGRAMRDQQGNIIRDVALELGREYTTPLFNMFNEKMYGKQYAQDAAKGQDAAIKEQSELAKAKLGAIKDAERMKMDRLKAISGIRKDMDSVTSPLNKELATLESELKEKKNNAPTKKKLLAAHNAEVKELEGQIETLKAQIEEKEAPYRRQIAELELGGEGESVGKSPEKEKIDTRAFYDNEPKKQDAPKQMGRVVRKIEGGYEFYEDGVKKYTAPDGEATRKFIKDHGFTEEK